jgi:Uma2 family endonuclease
MPGGIKRRCFTLDEYHRMGEAGILSDDTRIELLGGTIMVREPVGARHAAAVDVLARVWMTRVGDRAHVRVQNPVSFVAEMSELQPDVTLLRPRNDFYREGHPAPADVLLIIEVADSTLRLDRLIKMPLYGRAGVQEAWLLDLTADRIETYRGPTIGGYRERATFGRGTRVAPLAFPDIAVGVEDLPG